ncbi:MAG: hypothetical protein ACFFEF_16295 [Candidatus Thorarchaeota archaeon]
MGESSFFSRRLTDKELNLWMEIGKGQDVLAISKTFIHLADSMLFASFLGEDVIGASAIYRDRSRLSMALLSIRILEQYRERTTSHIMKSSLPFFKTVAIREADVLVAKGSEDNEYPFPLICVLGPWARKAIDENGFFKIAEGAYETYWIPHAESASNISWDSNPANTEQIRGLFWSANDSFRPDYSHFWLGVDLCREHNLLFTQSGDNSPTLVIGALPYEGVLYIPSVLYADDSLNDDEVVDALVNLSTRLSTEQICVLALEGIQTSVHSTLHKRFGEPTRRIPLNLMRKKL